MTDNHESNVYGHRFGYTETQTDDTALNRWMLAETNFVIDTALREGIDVAMSERTILAEAVATTLDLNPEAASALHARVGRIVVDHVLDTMRQHRLAG